MDEVVTDDTWAQLVCVTDTESPPIPMNKRKFTIGRGKGNDLSLPDNKLISTNHCYLERDSSGKVCLYDTSTNGTLLNMSLKLSKGERGSSRFNITDFDIPFQCRTLEHGDEFFIVFKKNSENLNTGYMYQDMEELAKEEDSDGDCTQEYDYVDPGNQTLTDEELNLPVTPVGKNKRTSKDEIDDSPPSKKQKSEESMLPKPEPSPNEKEVRKPESDSCASDEVRKTESKLCDKTDVNKTQVTENLPTEEFKKDKGQKDKKVETESDDMADTLTCIICQEILHNCISLQPCMHSFCAGCYSDWMAKSNKCPSCRLKVDRINKNHIVNNLVEAFLKEHPDKKRPEEDIKELENKNNITRDMLYPQKKKHKKTCGSDSEGSSECSTGSESEDYDDSDDDVSRTTIPSFVISQYTPPGGQLLGFGTPVFGTIRPPKTVCRQCQESKESADDSSCNSGIVGGIKTACNTVKNYILPGTNTVDVGNRTSSNDVRGDNPQAASEDVEPSTSKGDNAIGSSENDVKVMPNPPKYVCIPAQNHVLCQCCLQPMPDRRHERLNNPTIPAQQCAICYRAFCHVYWGCRKIDCLGCLAKFKDFNFGKKVLTNIVLDNATESNILKDYLEDKGISVRDMLLTCLQKLESGKYSCIDQARFTIDSNTVLCYPCGLRNLKDLAFQYRKDIPSKELPDTVTSRPDCYWGKNCRTQRNKPHHAVRFNHICDQIRTM